MDLVVPRTLLQTPQVTQSPVGGRLQTPMDKSPIDPGQVRLAFVSWEFCLWGFCPWGFCPRGFCPWGSCPAFTCRTYPTASCRHTSQCLCRQLAWRRSQRPGRSRCDLVLPRDQRRLQEKTLSVIIWSDMHTPPLHTPKCQPGSQRQFFTHIMNEKIIAIFRLRYY